MLARSVAVMLFISVLLGATGAWAGPEPPDLEKVVKSLQGIPVDADARYQQDADRYLRFIGAPPGLSFRTSAPTKSGDPEQAARAYLLENAKAFGSDSNRQGFSRVRVDQDGGRSHVRLQQTFDGVPVFGAHVNAQVGLDGGIQCLLSDIMRDTRLLEQKSVSTRPTIGKDAARQMALLAVRNHFPTAALDTTEEPILNLYHPAVVGDSGATRLVWIVTVFSPDAVDIVERVLIDAHSAATVIQYTLCDNVMRRYIYDAYGTGDFFGYIVRQEGQAPTQITDVDNAYDYLGDTYAFYKTEHNRDSMDGKGMDLVASVRIANFENASWHPYYQQMFFGDGFAVDDVTAHELTHGVTSHTSDLIYYFQSGAINEALSDIWGEFVDLTNNKGNDSDSVRWMMGEDLPGDFAGGIRDMQNPNNFGDPDKFSDYLYLPDWADNGGVHFNSGIANKLAYLLTDGDTFNGYTIQGFGINKVADLFYEAQVHLLIPASDYRDLGAQLVQAAYNLDYTFGEIRNVELAMQAVEIMPPEPIHPLQHLRATSSAGATKVNLSWNNPSTASSPVITLVRRTDRFPNGPTDLQSGSNWTKTSAEESLIDTEVAVGQEYFYGAFYGTGLDREEDFARVTVAGGEADYFSQAFVKIRGNALDLAFSQMTFDPVVDLTKAYASGETTGFWNYQNYVVTLKQGVYSLPIGTENAIYFKPFEDAYFLYTLRAPIPFFGQKESTVALAANGFIATATDITDQSIASPMGEFLFPSMKTHFAFPKIAFLFSDLSPASGGVVWFKEMPDRFVLTYERVPEFISNRGNTVQLELFYNGRIRMTWLEVNADDAIVGLSDGNGVPFDMVTGKVKESDLSKMPTSQAGSVIMEPVAPQFAIERGSVDFQMLVNAPTGQNPVFTFSKVGPMGEPIDLPTGAGVTPASGASARSASFHWSPSLDQGGYHTFRATFTQAGKVASQDIRVVVDNTSVVPILTDVPRITPAQPQDGETIRLSYTYKQEESVPEGPTVIRWLKDGVMMAGLTNHIEVSSQFTLPGQKWRALVTPVSFDGLEGITYSSAEVLIGPDITPDVNKDGAVNAIDLQLVVNSVLGLGVRALDADVDRDYVVNAKDVQLLVNTLIGRP